MAATDPYQTLGVKPGISDKELRAAYRRLVQLHHPDHNSGSAESARRFEEVQEAYARIRKLRDGAPRAAHEAPPRPTADPGVESRIADLERELREAQAARERARQAAREAQAEAAAARAAAAADGERPSDEELGYVRTDDSFSKILSDLRGELSGRLSEAREHPATKRVTDLIDELESKLTGRPPRPG